MEDDVSQVEHLDTAYGFADRGEASGGKKWYVSFPTVRLWSQKILAIFLQSKGEKNYNRRLKKEAESCKKSWIKGQSKSILLLVLPVI